MDNGLLSFAIETFLQLFFKFLSLCCIIEEKQAA